MDNRFVLIYQESTPISLMEMKYYQCGIVRLSSPGQEVVVSGREKSFLLSQMKNGTRPIFIEKDGG
jgi:hypothetical protein